MTQSVTQQKQLNALVLKTAPPQRGRLEIKDTRSPLVFRVTSRGVRTLSIRTRVNGAQVRLTWPGRIDPAASELPDLTTVRRWAAEMIDLCSQGIDPREAEKAEKEAQQKQEEERTANTFEAVVERWLKLVVVGTNPNKPKQRQGPKVAREVRKHLVSRWGGKPLDEVTRKDVIALVDDLEGRGTPALAHNVLGHCKTFFSWCISRDLLEHSPADHVKTSSKKKPRTRVLNDLELRAFWRAADRASYPFGHFFRMTLLVGQRREEVASARWSEFHPELVRLLRQREEGQRIDWSQVSDEVKVWTVGEERFKSDAPHVLPLTSTVCELLEELPFFTGGDYLFTTTHGRRPISGFSKEKAKLDRRMMRTLKALALAYGDDPRQVELENYTIHDLRRTMRTRMAALRIPDEVAEKCIGHGRKGLQRVYDQHRYVPEMREAFGAWQSKLRAITTPAGGKVINLLDATSRG